MNGQDQHREPRQINTNTGISIGVFVSVVVGIVWIVSLINGIKNDNSTGRNDAAMQMNSFKTEINSRFDLLAAKVATESSRDVVSGTEFFRWAVHLQQLNQDPRKLQTEGLKVPEPEVATKK